jgi:hypothetical protein
VHLPQSMIMSISWLLAVARFCLGPRRPRGALVTDGNALACGQQPR